MQRDLLGSWKKEPEVVFENLEWTRVKIDLKEPDRETAITLIEDVLHKTQEEDDKPHVLLLIAYAVRQQLFKSKEIDVKMIQKLAAWHPRCVEIDDDYTDYGWVTAYEDFKLDAKEDADDDDDDADEGFDEYVDDDEEEVADDGNFNDDFKEREAAMKKFKGAGMIELKRRCDIMGCSLKQGQEDEILDEIISFFCHQNYIIYNDYSMELFVERFMSRVKGYISSTCTLNDPNTVREALQTVEKMIESDADDPVVHQQDTVPTNEEGNECEIATPFNLPEQEEICLTPP
ncbi:PREDICTED: uncharacterized protein LOC101297440 [Fragaria vesca subsp. vesca]|uniref:uncharacterized protein LOC101297440 n=1 Tax=Fragaria vesca subsp. vesca TaxID=101020 RepID=UPI0002C3236A|nr:PREDICTED: uncharacterized protein LOC101297440 [Fragaria vesca subsp. vesca]XP_011464522.1 PREDICTED: uncharacterized protein LOC101297440 [Fragaria vesca subsp. vesca]XP_011464523.1 PREDICTED: uncharacterized protein LOC101297440 [Fragaria vesca subsp. vesca]XP_011464524.1 PREDICTED: uncharacterized protein LOC101297440 [Fragaria vesca subsp. vesca]